MLVRLLRSGAYVFLLSVLAKAFAFAKESIVAHEIGASRDLDCFLIAFLFVSIPVHFFFPALGSASVPYLLEKERESPQEAHRVFSAAFYMGLILAVLSALITVLFGRQLLPLLAAGFSAEDVDTAYRQAVALLPFLFGGYVTALLGAYLNAKGKNTLFSTYQAAAPILTGVFLLLHVWSPAIENQIWGHNFGILAMVPLMWFSARRLGLRLAPSVSIDSHLRPILGQWVPMVLAQSFVAVNVVVDKAMASSFGSGGVSLLDYGTKVFAMFSTLSMTTLSILLYPRFARLAANREFAVLRRHFKNGTLLVFGAAWVLVVLVWLFSDWGVAVAFERGAFGADKTESTATILRYYVLGLPIQLATILGARVLAAVKETRFLTYLGLLSMVANVICNVVLSRVFGLSGLALSTSAVALVVGAATYMVTTWQLNRLTNGD